jgi:hypothetical protein
VKLGVKLLSCLLVLGLGLSSCKSGPTYTECILSNVAGNEPVADCIDCAKGYCDPDTLKTLRGDELDGMYLYSPESRNNILKWAKGVCKQK